MSREGLPSLAAFIRRVREAQGLSVTALAERAELTKSEISAIENGRISLPGAVKRRRLADALGVSHLDLLVAAGEITDDELLKVGVEGVVIPRADDWATKLHDAVDLVSWDAKPDIAAGLLRMIEGIRQDQTRERERAGPGSRRSRA